MKSKYRGDGWYRLRDESLFVKPYLAGMDVREIAERTRYSADYVRRILLARGVWGCQGDARVEAR